MYSSFYFSTQLTIIQIKMWFAISDHVKPASPEEWPLESPMYSSDLRDQITLSKEPDTAINQRRSQFMVPGSQLPETPQEARLPLLLLSRPPSSVGLGEALHCNLLMSEGLVDMR